MPTTDDLKRGNYLTKEDFPKPRLVIISGYNQVNVARQGKPADMRYVLTFQGLSKPMTLNKTNGNIIANITGSKDFDDWIGARVVLYNEPNVEFGGEIVGGLRIKEPPGTTVKQEPVEEPEEPEEPKSEVDDIPY